jgi:hypothetical protein
VLTINLNELQHKEVLYVGTTLTGILDKFLEPNHFGIVWKQGQEYRKYGFPCFWNESEKILIKDLVV